MVKLLVEKEFLLDNQDPYGYPAILQAYRAGSVGIVEYLAKNGANVHLEKGSDLNIKNKQEKTAFELAETNGYFESAKIISGETENPEP